jgi:arylsulfatase A-like enzyme
MLGLASWNSGSRNPCSRTERLAFGALGALGALLLASCGAEPVAPRGPNLLVVTVDTIRVDHTSAYGYSLPTTPTLERLAEGGVLIEDVYAPMPTTGPSHASLFTSLHPLSLGYLNNFQSLGEAAPTLAEILSSNGYETAAVVSSTPVSRASGLDRGFQHFDDAFSDGGEHKRRAGDTTVRAERWLRLPGEKPFFLWVHYFDPHAPYAPPMTYIPRFAPLSLDRFAWRVAKYDAGLRFTDDALGRLLESLRSLAHLEDTLVVVTGDHGEGLMEHGFMTHGPLLYEEDVKVPLILHWPGRLSRMRLAGPVELRDVPRTVLELLGVPAPPSLEGRSFAAAVTGREPLRTDQTVLLQRRTYEGEDVHGIRVRGQKFGIRKGRWKYLEAPEEGTKELFDLERDPGERNNLADAQPERAAALSELLGGLTRPSGTPDASGSRWSTDDLERLEALGYVR